MHTRCSAHVLICYLAAAAQDAVARFSLPLARPHSPQQSRRCQHLYRCFAACRYTFYNWFPAHMPLRCGGPSQTPATAPAYCRVTCLYMTLHWIPRRPYRWVLNAADTIMDRMPDRSWLDSSPVQRTSLGLDS